MGSGRARGHRMLLWCTCALMVTGCGRFASADRAADAPAVSVGSPSTQEPAPSSTESPTGPTTSERVAASSVETSSAPPSSVQAPPSTPVANAATATTDGLDVEVVAENGPHYPSRPRFRIQVTLRNRSERTRYHFLGQGNFAAITDGAGAVVWTSGGCNPTLDTYEIYGGASPVEPGEEVPAIVEYPGPEPVDPDCDLPDGTYALHGLFPVCPDEHVEETANPGTYSCPEDQVVMYESAGLTIRIGG